MRKLIRSAETKAFLTTDGVWTHDLEKARPFPTSNAAQTAMHELQLRAVELYYSFDETQKSQWDFVLPLE